MNPTEKQKNALRKFGVKQEEIDQMDMKEASDAISKLIDEANQKRGRKQQDQVVANRQSLSRPVAPKPLERGLSQNYDYSEALEDALAIVNAFELKPEERHVVLRELLREMHSTYITKLIGELEG